MLGVEKKKALVLIVFIGILFISGTPGDTTLLLMFCRGKRCESWDENFCFYYDENEGNCATDFLANDKGWFLVSAKLRELICWR